MFNICCGFCFFASAFCSCCLCCSAAAFVACAAVLPICCWSCWFCCCFSTIRLKARTGVVNKESAAHSAISRYYKTNLCIHRQSETWPYNCCKCCFKKTGATYARNAGFAAAFAAAFAAGANTTAKQQTQRVSSIGSSSAEGEQQKQK